MEYPEYLNLITQLIGTNKPVVGDPLTAAALGNILRKAAPTSTYREFGKSSLREVLEDLRAEGRVALTETSKGAFAVDLPFTGDDNLSPRATAQPEPIQPLRKEVWHAFTFTAPPGKRFLNRTSGVVRVGLNAPPAPAADWAEITPISPGTQLGWAQEFVKGINPDVHAAVEPALSGPAWNGSRFVAALRDCDMHAARAWNRLRSTRVAMAAQEWITANALPPKLAFQLEPNVEQAQPSSARTPVSPLISDQATRAIIVAALSKLPLAQLLQIPLPVGLVLEAIAPHAKR